MRKRRVYVSGPMSGHPDWNRAAFEKRAAELRAVGYEPVIPHDIEPRRHDGDCDAVGRPLGHVEGHGTHNYGCYLLADIVSLATCDLIAILPRWETSPGARAEYAFALACDMREVLVGDGWAEEVKLSLEEYLAGAITPAQKL